MVGSTSLYQMVLIQRIEPCTLKGQAGYRRSYYSLRTMGEESLSHSVVSMLCPRVAESCIKHQITIPFLFILPSPPQLHLHPYPQTSTAPPPSRLPNPPQLHPHPDSPALHSISLSWRCDDKKTKVNRYKLGSHRQVLCVFTHEHFHCFCFYSLAPPPHTQLLGMHTPFFPFIHVCIHPSTYSLSIHPCTYPHIYPCLCPCVCPLRHLPIPSHSILQDD